MAYQGDWRTVPEFKAWVDQAEAWKKEFGVYKFVWADGDGLDAEGETKGLGSDRVWTLKSLDIDWIVPGKFEGDWGSGGVTGWFLAEKPWNESNKFDLPAMKVIACVVCGNGEISDSDDCEACEYEGTIWMRLEDTGWGI